MTKSIKTILISALSGLLLILCFLWCALSVTPKVKAADGAPVNPTNYTKYNLTAGGGDFSFSEGAALSDVGPFTEDNMELGFGLNVLTRTYSDLMTINEDKWDNKASGKEVMGDKYVFKFTLYRCNDDESTAVALENIYIFLNYWRGPKSFYLNKMIFRESIIYYDEEVRLYGFDDYDFLYQQEDFDSMVGYFKGRFAIPNTWELVSCGGIYKGGLFNDTEKTSGMIGVKTASPYTKYFVRFDYDFYVCERDRILVAENNYDEDFKHYVPSASGVHNVAGRQPADSSVRSVYEILQGMNDAGVLSDYLDTAEELELANNILTNTEIKTVRVRYLKDIDGTPFAEMYETALTIPVRNGSVDLVEVTKALNKDYLHALNGKSIAKEIHKNNDGVYVVYYGKSLWLRAFTEGSQSFDYQLDSNLSYRDFYQPYVDAELITEDLMEERFTKLIQDYPELYAYNENEVYGFFGLIMIPNNYDLNDVYKAVFGVDEVSVGIFNQFSFVRPMTIEKFNSLMKDYNFSWFKMLETYTNIFHGLGNNFTANVFMFCADGQTRDLLIGMGGQDDPNDGGAVTEDNKGLIQKIKDFFDSSTETLADLGKDIGTNKAAIIIIAIVVLLVIVFIKTGLFSAIINGKFKRRK